MRRCVAAMLGARKRGLAGGVAMSATGCWSLRVPIPIRSTCRSIPAAVFRLSGKPLKTTKDTDAIFENVNAARTKSADDPDTLEISRDTNAKVRLGEYPLGGKIADRQ